MNYTKMLRLLVVMCGLLILSASDLQAQTLAQKKPEAFALGVNMGFASFQLQVATTKPRKELDPYSQTVGSVKNASKFVYALNESKDAPVNMLDPKFLDDYVKTFNNNLEQTDETLASIKTINYDKLVALRTSYGATLSKISPALTNAYLLGVNLSIAEGQTTGEPARQIVYASLINARTSAQALKLDTSDLNICIEMAGGKTSLEDIRQKLMAVRATYQALL